MAAKDGPSMSETLVLIGPRAARERPPEERAHAALDFLRGIPLCAGLSSNDLQALARDLVPRRFAAGETLFREGDPGQALYLLAAGQVRIYVQGEEGQETSVNLCGPGDVFGELAVIDDRPRSASAVAGEEALAYVLSRDLFRAHVRRCPQLALNLLNALSVRVRYNTEQVGSLATLDIPARLARKLLALVEMHGVPDGDGVRIEVALTQSDLASLIGATRESINKALAAFRRQGLIRLADGRIVVVDRERLAAL